MNNIHRAPSSGLYIQWARILAAKSQSQGSGKAFPNKFCRRVCKNNMSVFLLTCAQMTLTLNYSGSCLGKGRRPVFHRARPVPFVIREVLGRELACLKKEGFIE